MAAAAPFEYLQSFTQLTSTPRLTGSWGTNWTCLDSCCRCKCCWDDGEFVPEDQPNHPSNAHKAEAAAAAGAQGGDETAAPPAYKAAEPMSAAKPAEAEAVAAPAAAPAPAPAVESAVGDAAATKQ